VRLWPALLRRGGCPGTFRTGREVQAPRRFAPTAGWVDPADLYQLAAYASRYAPERVAALVYRRSTAEIVPTSGAEGLGPWRRDEQTFAFQRLPTDAVSCRAALQALLTESK
jgi:hypothetical protein